MAHSDIYPKPSVTADIVVIRNGRHRNDILCIRRKHDPYKGQLALPGGFVDPTETVLEAAVRELQEETGLVVPEWKLKLVGVYSDPGRDPRGWTIATAFVTKGDKFEPVAGDDADSFEWLPFSSFSSFPQALAFDHAKIIGEAVAVARYG